MPPDPSKNRWALGLAMTTAIGWSLQSPSQETVGGRQDDVPWQEVGYPKSDLLAGVEFDFSTARTEALGSDIWPITWADNDHQYAAFGDGAGFGVAAASESNGRDRVSLGISRIEGSADGYVGRNVWGGKAAEHPATFDGKGTGILSLGGALYMWVAGPGSLCVPETQLAVSRDYAATWERANWKWTMQDRLFAGNFLDCGRDGAEARDGYIYAYFTRLAAIPEQPRNWIHERPGQVDLARAPRERLLEQSAWEWFEGTSAEGVPRWTHDLSARQPVFEDPNGIKLVSVCRQPELERCLLLYNPKDNRGNFGLFESRQPWGPWREVAYLKSVPQFSPPEPNTRVSVFHFAPKWWNDDGRQFTLIYNTGDDAWNTVRGRLVTR